MATAETVATPGLSRCVLLSWLCCSLCAEKHKYIQCGEPQESFLWLSFSSGSCFVKVKYRTLGKSPFIPSPSSLSWGSENSDAHGGTESQITWDSDQGPAPSLVRLEKIGMKPKYGSRPVNLDTRLAPWERTGSEFAKPLGRRKGSLAKWTEGVLWLLHSLASLQITSEDLLGPFIQGRWAPSSHSMPWGCRWLRDLHTLFHIRACLWYTAKHRKTLAVTSN